MGGYPWIVSVCGHVERVCDVWMREPTNILMATSAIAKPGTLSRTFHNPAGEENTYAQFVIRTTNNFLSHLRTSFRINILWSNKYDNVKHQFMALKRESNLNGYHSPTVRRKYKSRYSLESRHWYISSDAIIFSYWYMKGYLFKGYILPKQSNFYRVTTVWLIINHPIWAWNCDFKPIGRYEN